MHMIYELLYILPSQYSETEIEGANKVVAALLKKAGAKIEKTESLGKIKFAYPIKKVKHGTYILNYFTIEDNENLKKLDTDLKHSEEVLRHIFVKREDGIPTHEVQLNSYQEPLTPEGKRSAKEQPPKLVRKQAPVATEKLSTAELDKKLDEILESDITDKV